MNEQDVQAEQEFLKGMTSLWQALRDLEGMKAPTVEEVEHAIKVAQQLLRNLWVQRKTALTKTPNTDQPNERA